ncbi:unnamed protein product [Vicia faba]|uniref:DUF4005 domain-containing protein n=1 Tax=Vicia faba TaxID=3906 RepID=A0AAV1ADY8_VICFA|nr:unnamed protein product [Vicia faba]
MVKSNSCLRLITCGGGDKEQDQQVVSEVKSLTDSQVKDSNDKRGWSFRKRSARHRVLSNTVIATETPPSSVNKEIPEYSKVPETIVTETEDKADVDIPESAVIIVQASIRGYLAQRALIKSKNVVKLQAAVRGHLVRRHAVGTLRCVQAIVKMQLLVRARQAQQSHSSKNDYSKTLDNEHPTAKSNAKHSSVEKLLSNKFARQLMESTPKNKSIHVKCNPSEGDSAWKWLERWMSVSAKDSAENKKPVSTPEQLDETRDSTRVSQLETDPSEVILQLADSPLPSEDEEKTSTYGDTNSYFQAIPSTSSLIKDKLEEGPPEKMVTNNAKEASPEIDSFQNEITESNASVGQDPGSPLNRDVDGEKSRQSVKAFAPDQLEAEGKKIASVSRKLSNPAFIAAQSKFEELSSNANSGRPNYLFDQDVSVESQADTAYISKEFISSENSTPYPSRIGDPESGTVLSISSTLDSPDRSETLESEHDAKDLVEGIVNPENKTGHSVEADKPSATPTISSLNQLENVNSYSGNIVDPVNSKESVVEPEKNVSDLFTELTETVRQDFKLSPEASPGSYMTIPESQGTPSSQVSVKPKENKINKTGSSSRRRVLSIGNKSPANSSNDSGSRVSVGNKSPANANPDSGSRGSKEQLPKDHLNGKRRNSFGSIKPDHHNDQEPTKDNSSNNISLPRFMQATQSARAKINANSSPRSSPDVHDQDVSIKKRHSLPGATGRQGSPRVEQSISPAQQGTKGNVSTERKWQR